MIEFRNEDERSYFLTFPSPDVQWLHCIEQFDMEGGENEFVDGYRLLDIIRRNHPEIWKVMTTMPIEWLDTGCIGRDKVNRQLFFPQIKHQNRKNGNV